MGTMDKQKELRERGDGESEGLDREMIQHPRCEFLYRVLLWDYHTHRMPVCIRDALLRRLQISRDTAERAENSE